jgi:hypothetical protein
VLFSFFNRFFSKSSMKSEQIEPLSEHSSQKNLFYTIAENEKGDLQEHFSLFYQEEHHLIDLLFFLPYRGIITLQRLGWSAQSLKGFKAHRTTPKNRKNAATHVNSTQTLIRQKLSDLLSFDSTVCEPMIWLEHLSENEYDLLDPSFHQHLPKDRLIFGDSTQESIIAKFNSLAPLRQEPYIHLKVMGSLQSHALILPDKNRPYGALLSDEQLQFLGKTLSDTLTPIFGEHNSGKTTLVVRKILFHLLTRPKEKILVITPTLIGGELIRNELIALQEYGVVSIRWSSLSFATPYSIETIEKSSLFRNASLIVCDDAYAMEKSFLDTLIAHREKQSMIVVMHNQYAPLSEDPLLLHNDYQPPIAYAKVPSRSDKALMTLLLELRSRLTTTHSKDIMVMLPDDAYIAEYKEAIDEYFHLNARILTKEFSLQYRHLDDLLITTAQNCYGIHVPHVYLLTDQEDTNYSYPLSRASESATIISLTKSPEKSDPATA